MRDVRKPTFVTCVAALYAPVMAVVSRVWDSADARRGCARDEFVQLRSQLHGTSPVMTAPPDGEMTVS